MAVEFVFVNVRRFKRGATHSDGSTWLCIRCQIDDSRRRSNQAEYTAVVTGNGYRLHVGYCEDHVPDEVKEKA